MLVYPTATAVIQASWAWTHDNKEMDVYAERGSIRAGRWDVLSTRAENSSSAKVVKPARKPAQLEDEWTYLRKVVRGECGVDALSSLELNVIVADILERARHQVGCVR